MPSDCDQKILALRAEIAKLLNCEVGDLSPESSIRNHPSWDSMAHVQIMMFLSTNFGIEINDQTVNQFSEFSQIEELCRRSD